MNYHVPDMDHNGEVTSKDAGIFHEMMDNEWHCDPNYGKSTWDIFGECGLLALLALVVPLAPFLIIDLLITIFH